jgi:hypothetical protein
MLPVVPILEMSETSAIMLVSCFLAFISGQRMGNEMLANPAEMPAENPPLAREKRRLCTVDTLDQRTRGARRVAELTAVFEAELRKTGRTLTAAEGAAVRNAALLSAISEDAGARRLAGDATVTLEDVVRLSRAAAAAMKALAIKPSGTPAPPTLAEHLASRAAERAGGASGDRTDRVARVRRRLPSR